MTDYNYTHSIDAFDYDPVNHIATSTLAIVYAGRSKRDPSQKVAIKKFGTRVTEERQKHTINDIKIMKELSHPNIVKIIAFSLITNMVYLVTEFCNGGDLDDYLRETGAMVEDTIRIFLRQVGSGLAYLRERNVVHRDLKPNNILLDYSKHGYTKTKEELYKLSTREITFKIVDFGLSKFIHIGVGTTTDCTPEFYRAPEVFMNWKHDWQVDIWSLGIVTLQCIHGYHPLLKNLDYTKAWQDPHFEFPFLTSTSYELKSLVKRMLESNPMLRITVFTLMKDVYVTGGTNAFTQSRSVGNESSPGPSTSSGDQMEATHFSGDTELDENEFPRPTPRMLQEAKGQDECGQYLMCSRRGEVKLCPSEEEWRSEMENTWRSPLIILPAALGGWQVLVGMLTFDEVLLVKCRLVNQTYNSRCPLPLCAHVALKITNAQNGDIIVDDAVNVEWKRCGVCDDVLVFRCDLNKFDKNTPPKFVFTFTRCHSNQ